MTRFDAKDALCGRTATLGDHGQHSANALLPRANPTGRPGDVSSAM